MHDASDAVSLQHQLTVLRRHRWAILGTVVVAVVLAVALSATSERRYEAQAVVSFNDESQDLRALGVPAAPTLQPEKAAAAQAKRVTRSDVAAAVRARLPFRPSVARLQDAVTTEVQPDSNLVSLTVTWDRADRAAAIADAFATVVRKQATEETRARYLATARSLDRRARDLDPVKDATRRAVYADQASRLQTLASFSRPVDVVRQAEVPDAPTSPKPVRNAILAGVLGLLLGVGIAALRHALDRRLRDVAELHDAGDIPVVGYVRNDALGRPAINSRPRGGREDPLDAFRILRTNLELLAPDRVLRAVLVTSAMPEEGKSTVAASLAYAEAVAGRRTLLVECDLRKPTAAERLGLAPGPGLADFLAGRVAPPDVLQPVELGDQPAIDGLGGQLVCITAGAPAANAAELLGSPRFGAFMKDVTAAYDRVVLDCPPLLPVGDTLSMLPHVDAALLCIRLGRTTREQAGAARTALRRVPGKPLGTVTTGIRNADLDDVGYYPYAGAGATVTSA